MLNDDKLDLTLKGFGEEEETSKIIGFSYFRIHNKQFPLQMQFLVALGELSWIKFSEMKIVGKSHNSEHKEENNPT